MTIDEVLKLPDVTREEKLVALYEYAPDRLSRGTYSLIDALKHVSEELKVQLTQSHEEAWEISVNRIAKALYDGIDHLEIWEEE